MPACRPGLDVGCNSYRHPISPIVLPARHQKDSALPGSLMKPRLGTAKVGPSITCCGNAVQWWRQTEKNWSDYILELTVRNGVTDNVLNPRKSCLISSSLILLVEFLFFASSDPIFSPAHVKGWMSAECQGCQQFVTRQSVLCNVLTVQNMFRHSALQACRVLRFTSHLFAR